MYLILYPVTINTIIMKKIQLIILLLFLVNSNAQSVIRALKMNEGGPIAAGTYFQDMDDDIDSFQGSYEYSNNGIVFRIHLLKKTMAHVANYYADTLIGEIEYYENGSQLVNTAAQLNTNFSNIHDHAIAGAQIRDNGFGCPDCTPGEIILESSYFDSRLGGELTLRKTTVSGIPALKVNLYAYASSKIRHSGDPIVLPVIPTGDYIMVKLP
jgi:hypothetical protein